MADLLAGNPPLLLFVCLAIGGAVGAVRVRRFTFGAAAVLFTALAYALVFPAAMVTKIIAAMPLAGG